MARLKRLFGLQFLFALTCVLSAPAHAQTPITINVFDFDGTVVEDRQIRDGAFNPEFILFRNNTRLNLFQEVASGPEQISVTHQDLEKMKVYLAQSEGRPGAVGRVVKLANGESIKPGEYYLRMPDSFRNFREGAPGDNRLLHQFQNAERVATETGKTFKGPAWDYFVHLCQTEEGARTVAISTARGHSEREWRELFDHMQKQGLIKFKPAAKRVFNMMRPEFDRFSGHGGALGADPWNIPQRKAMHFREILLVLRNVALPAKSTGEPRVLHDVRFFENSPENLAAIQRVTREIIFADASPSRVTLVNVGLTTDIREAREMGRPEVAILEPGSAVFRSGRREDFMLPTKDSNLPTAQNSASAIRTCEGLFAKVAP
ncbi:hypothetical protein BH10BDE1_BH10BDE1_03540 [soil metagenome]